jgi:hypothetical protein
VDFNDLIIKKEEQMLKLAEFVKKYDKALFILGLAVIVLLLSVFTNAFAGVETVKDNNDGVLGQILVNTGTRNGQSDVGTWTDPSFLKGDKGDTGATGQQGIQGIAGINGTNGIDGINGLNGDPGIQGIQGFNGVDGKNGLDGLNGLNGIDGLNGVAGVKGDTGLQGIQGVKGLDVDPTTVTNLQTTDNTLQNNINSANSRIDNVSNRVSKLERTQYVVKTELKFIREKHLEVGVYAEYNAGRNVCSEVGLNIVIPIGDSYLDRENKKINSRLDRLESKVGGMTIIERTIDKKGVVRSISISQGQLAVNGEF